MGSAPQLEPIESAEAAPLNADEVIRTAEFRQRLRRFAVESERIAAANGLTPQRYLLLLMIKGAPDGSECSTVTELSERLGLAQHTVTELVARAEQVGLIEREKSLDDRRVVHLRLTERGEERFAAAFRSQRAERRALEAALRRTEEEQS
jgi:DNA-binding MarR family transcriptional regulator